MNAWVVLLMINKSYLLGALTVARSLRAVKTRHDIICMVTNDITEDIRKILLGTRVHPLFTKVIEVSYISHSVVKYTSKKQAELYNGWIDKSFTKWNCLLFEEYDKIILLDADMLVMVNCDDLFDLQPPAAPYTNPWAYPWQQVGGIINTYEWIKHANDLYHGSQITPKEVLTALTNGSFVGIGAVVLLKPNKAHYQELLEQIYEDKIFGSKYNTVSGADEVSIAAFYANKNINWTHIHQRYTAFPWKKTWVANDIRIYHYHGRKPWDLHEKEWSDLRHWWKTAEKLVSEHKQLKDIFYPNIASELDIAIYQLKITQDIRSIIWREHKKYILEISKDVIWEKINNIMSKWLEKMSQINNTSTVYINLPINHEINVKFISDLIDDHIVKDTSIIKEILELISFRLGQCPQLIGAKVEIDQHKVTYGSHFTVSIDKVQTIIKKEGVVEAIKKAIKNETLCLK